MSSTTDPDSVTTVGGSADATNRDHKGLRQRALRRAQHAITSRDVFLFLLAFRILNALSIKTFFQPDEFFQSLEPAWQIAFGPDSGAWITWEWKHHLRSAIHPYLFATIYWLAAAVAKLLHLSAHNRAELLIAAPKVFQAIFAATGDYYTWQLGQKVYGNDSNEAWATVRSGHNITINVFETQADVTPFAVSPWQWFCSTRTLSNCLETTLTTAALYLWPWQWSLDETDNDNVESDGLRSGKDDSQPESVDQLTKLRRCLVLAALACVLRPTNLLIWACLACFSLFHSTKTERVILIRETAICGSLVLTVSALFDRLYYRQWVFPPLRFLYFNIAQSLAVFYGRNDWSYYATQGYPLLLTTYLPFALLDIHRAITRTPTSQAPPAPAISPTIRHQLATLALLVPLPLSLISHKEVRFIYPLLPPLHILAAASVTHFFLPAISPASPTRSTRPSTLKRVLLLPALLATNALIALLATTSHQPGPLTALAYLRAEHESHYLTQPPASAPLAPAPTVMTAAFLMPCHSTPWRSHLVHPGIHAWALSCDPPVHRNASARAVYRDEADQFYADPVRWLDLHLGPPPRRKGVFGGKAPQRGLGMGGKGVGEEAWDGGEGAKAWPDYLVFFGALQGALKGVLGGSAYRECWRGWNSWGHDDARRKGDVVVWCLRGGEGEGRG
ncbi:glycosylphosphatidylinositol anchor biosynthesis [Xylographa pallens]|nr:glycosylphosphatidylinositol anchor biosynthesis [Xylographa pallens]